MSQGNAPPVPGQDVDDPPAAPAPRTWVFRDPLVGRSFRAWLYGGIALRLLLLPIGITTDTLATYWRAHLIAFHGDVYREYLVNMGSHVVHAGWLRVVQPLLGPADAMWTHPWWWADPFGLGAEHMERFLARPDALRAIALLKLPYVLAELGAGLIVLRLAWGPADGLPRDPTTIARTRRTWILWMLSPAALYATLLFARYEAFPVLAVLAALLVAERGRTVWAAVLLGLAITFRTYPIVLVPVFALVLYRDLLRQAAWAALALAPFALTMLANRVVGGTFGELASVGDYSFGDNWFAFAFQPSRGGPGWYLFPAVLLAIGGYLLGRDREWWGSGPVPREHLWRWVALAHLAMFAFSQFSAHYLMWVVPAVALVVGRTSMRGTIPLHLASVLGVFVAAFVLWGGILFTGTLGGLGDTARTLLPPGAPLSGEGGQQLANLGWTLHVVATLGIAVPLLVGTIRGDRFARAVR